MVLTQLFVIVLLVFLFFGDSLAHLFKERGFFCVVLVFFNGVYDDFDVQNFALCEPVYDDRQVFVIEGLSLFGDFADFRDNPAADCLGVEVCRLVLIEPESFKEFIVSSIFVK